MAEEESGIMGEGGGIKILIYFKVSIIPHN
jgi:hypothetical protein